MKLIPLFLLFLLATAGLSAQKPTVPRFSKHQIGSSACSAYFPEEAPLFEESYSQDSSVVITSETIIDDHSFDLIHVDFREKITDSLDRENILVSYLDYLQQSFSIAESAGYGKGHSLEKYPKAQGIIDFWRDLDDNEYSVKGWITEDHITVFVIHGKGQYPYPAAQEMYFNGIRY
ncbi:MAG: hypothetical protein ACO1O6_04370 [Bacteroidota bacterium]